MPCFTGFFASPQQSKFCQNAICQKPVRNGSARWADRAAFCQTNPLGWKSRLQLRSGPEWLRETAIHCFTNSINVG
jgi:hypothetical protein